MNKKLLFSIIAVAFVGSLFTAVYAGPVFTTITLAGTVDMVNNQIKNLQDPTDPQDAATKSFVESLFACEGGAEMCSVGLGECQRDGINICTSGVAQCGAVPGPASSETCDGLDNDCDGEVDDELATTTFYEDADFDGFGNFDSSTESCSQPAGFVTDNSDCDDTNALVSPAAIEICDGLDNDCNGVTPDGVDEVWFSQPCDGLDSDFCIEGTFLCSGGLQTCSDATGDDVEVCDGVDNNCDGQVDEGRVCGPENCVPGCFEGEVCNAGVCIPVSCVPACSAGEVCDTGICIPQ